MKLDYNKLFTDFAYLEKDKTARQTKSHLNNRIKEEKIILPPTVSCNREDVYFNLIVGESLYFKEDLKQMLSQVLANCLSWLLQSYNYKKDDLVLVIGLGNQGMVADSLGARTLEGLNITSHLIRRNAIFDVGNLCGLGSSVSGVTGIESFDIIRGVVDRIKPKIIIAVDTLSCSDVEKLQRIIQINNTGIEPGGGINNPKKKISYATLQIPVIALGVPLVIYVKDIIRHFLKENVDLTFKRKLSSTFSSLVVTSKEIDIVVEDYSKVIAKAINTCCSSL